MKRKDIMDECPDEFEASLKEFIDSVESEVNEIKNNLEITCIGDVGSIEDAYNLASDLCDKLY
jgi:hypothetical protein